MASYDIGDDMRGLIGVVGPTPDGITPTVAARLTALPMADQTVRQQEKQELPPKEDTDT